MKTFVTLALAAVLTINLAGCSTPEERKHREAQREREDREDARREGERSAQDYLDFLVGYARHLGKTPSELTSAERADARHEYNNGYYRGGGYGYGHHWWY